ncbi:MAG TPA: hypothetical protein VM889_00175 [Candidatus Thermoplasmatota archaeon]|nr:hypothetical protein [Candidatus Thermoplasmatota archaeon]
MRAILIVLALALPALAGCFGPAADMPAPDPLAAANDSVDAGAVAGTSPVGPKKPFKVEVDNASGTEKVVAHPVRFKTNPAREPIVVERAGTLNTTNCLPTGRTPISHNWRWFSLGDDLRPGDVFTFDVALEYENKDNSWADLHLVYSIGGREGGDYTARGDARGPQRQNFSDQGFHGEDTYSGFGVVCWSGLILEPLAFKLTATLTFVEGGIPAGVPLQIEVPANATRFIVSGVPIDPAKGVLSHYRLFGPDDRLLCECALSSNKQAHATPLVGPGDYVLLVDHTDNGFVTVSLDAPSPERALPLGMRWKSWRFAVSDGETNPKKTFPIEFPTVPLRVGAGLDAEQAEVSLAVAKTATIHLANAHGDVLVRKIPGYVEYGVVGSGFGFGLPLVPGTREYRVDHHNFRPGPHTLEVSAEACRCHAVVHVVTYERAV